VNVLPSLWGRRWVRYWAHTPKGERTLEELLDLGYILNSPPPISGGGRNFDGVDDQINRGADDASLDVTNSESCMLQVLCKLDAVGTVTRCIAGKKNGLLAAGSGGYSIGIAATEVVQWGLADGVDQVTRSGITMVAGTWVTLTGVLRANAAADDDLIVYDNLNASATLNSTVLGSLANTHTFRIGANATGEFWDGDVAFARFWSLGGAAWTAAQIDEVVTRYTYLYLPAGWGPGVQGIQWILWDRGSPTTATDYSGNGLNGTYTGTTFVDDPAMAYPPMVMPRERTLVRM